MSTDYTFYNASRTGYTFDGWYQDEKDVGDASKLLTGLNKAKKWELYGRYDPIPYNLVIYAAIDKDKDNAVNIYSGMVDYGTPLVAYLETLDLKTDVFPGYSPEDGKWYKYDSPKWTFGENDTVSGWTNVLINYVPNEYTIYYHGSGGVTESGAEQSTSTFKYGSEATIKNNPFTYEGYAFEGWALSADGEVVYTGSEKVPFTEEYFRGLLENGKVEFYAVWAEDELGGGDNGNEPDGIADYRQVFVKYVAADGNGSVDPRFNTFSLEVDENGKVMTNVALSLEGVATPNGDATFAYWTIDGLGFDGGAYSYEANLSGKGFTGYVAGQTYTFTAYFNGPVVKPEQPNVYEINVTVHNGTATFCGSEVTSHILAAENEDITITFTPDEGYTLDYATIDGGTLLIPDGGVYTLKQVDSDHTIEVFYAKDENGGGEDGDEPDGTPDYRQVFVKYVAGDKNGFVTPSHDTFDLDVDENGKVMTDVALALSGTATANTDASFGYWTIEGSGYDGGTYSFEADLENENFSGYLPGETYTFTAYFNGPVVKPEQPNVYDIYVTVHNGTATFCGSEVTSHILAAENEDITITFTPDEGYTLDYATIDGNMLLIPDGGVYMLKQVDRDHTIEVVYAVDELGGGDDGDEPDGTPDYRQVFVKYVAADGNGFVTPSSDTFNLKVDENGKVMTNVALSLKGEATPNADATFAYWTINGLGYDGGAYSYEDKLSGKDFTGYVAGQTYTFTAYFNGPVVKPEQVPYNINVEVVNGTAEFKGTNIGANSVINVYPIEDDNKNVTITFVPEDGFVFDAAYVGNEPVDLKDNSYTFGEVTADVTIKVLFKQDSVPITPVTPMPTPGEISDLIKDSITVDCVNGEVAHAEKVYGLLDGSLVNVEKTDDTSIKVTLDATVYQARYNTDTETKHSLADGQSATVTFALNYVDQTWRVAEGELPITIKVVCETPVSPAVPEKPSYSDIASLFRSSIQVDCVSKSYHKTGVYGLLTDGYTVSAPVKGSDGKYTCTVTLLANAYLAKYNNSFGYAKHSLASYQGNESVTLKWNEAEEEWNTVYGQLPVTIDVVCKNYIPVLPSLPDVPDDTTPNWLNLDDHDAYIQGYPDGRVKPQNNITRAEVATIFFRLLTDDARDYYYSTDSGFSDVKPGDWYNTAVATMVQAGILNGYSDGTFKPNASITRAEFATIAARFLSNPYSTKDRFYDTEGHWAEVYINRAAEIGWIGGYPDGSFKPDRYITRAEAVTLVNNVLGREPHADYMLDDMITWPDNPKSAWYYEDIQEATNSHDYRWSSSKSYEIWTKLL